MWLDWLPIHFRPKNLKENNRFEKYATKTKKNRFFLQTNKTEIILSSRDLVKDLFISFYLFIWDWINRFHFENNDIGNENILFLLRKIAQLNLNSNLSNYHRFFIWIENDTESKFDDQMNWFKKKLLTIHCYCSNTFFVQLMQLQSNRLQFLAQSH